MTNIYVIEKENDGITIKDYIRTKLGFSSRALKLLKYKGKIIADGKEVFVNFVLRYGMTLELHFPEEASESIIAENIPLDVLYEDDDFLAVNKPKNMPVHPSRGHITGTLANAVMYRYRDKPFVFRVLTRLDTDTTGVVILAKNAVAAHAFSFCHPVKQYVAVCVGTPEKRSGEIDAPIARDEGIIKRCVNPCGKPSLTKYEVIKSENGVCLVRAIPVTGRTHQIRVHLSYIGYPLYGDFLYGTEVIGERTRLHCETVNFKHPFSGEDIIVTAPVPEDITAFFSV